MLRRERENILIMTLIPDIEMRLIEMFRDLAVYCGSITKFLLSTACALFFTMSTNFVVGAANGCRDILAEGIGRESINFGTIHFLALSRPFLFTWRSWQPLYMVPTGKRVSTLNRCCPLQNPKIPSEMEVAPRYNLKLLTLLTLLILLTLLT